MLAANGIGKDAFWRTLLAGESGIGPITQFETTDFKSRIAGEVSNFVPENFMNGRVKARRLSRNVQLGAKAALLAVEDSGLNPEDLRRAEPLPIIIGISLGGFDHIENQILRVSKLGPNKLVPHAVEGCIHLAAASLIGAILNVETELCTISNSCVGGLDSIARGAQIIREGKADICICGATEAPIVPSAMAGFCAAGMVSTNNDNPKLASRPFDISRDGGVLAEGSGIVVLESLDHAMSRNKAPYAEVLGYGTSRDLNVGISGNGLKMSMRKALANSSLMPREIDAIFAHGPSDQILDVSESILITDCFGDHAYRIPVTSIKGVTGNPLAAGGAHQTIACSLSMKANCIPPTANHKFPDPDCLLDYVPDSPRHLCVDKVLINSHGSGAMNSSLIIGSAS
ncbi:3-oxoacyl-[acyl-carrier-protein] synthase 2 [Pontiella sulfatireligans]|uniref:3-oxoacyl-[acyl-carrier-protein] synthase 2 n=1 Tax=Pontiella sulfatireligans TaxID=2750658 RepID=A0A6C2UQ36_9BACT|nr:3-oxoacyl-[acyl-carrier-protein] synthase 2 [Pontiella sulfatireligans]